MSTKELEIEMVRNGDTGTTLSEFLGITECTFSKKRSGKVDFNRQEMYSLKCRWKLSDARFVEIFFAQDAS